MDKDQQQRMNARMKRLIVVSVIVMIALAFGMFFYVKKSIHNEREVYLEAQTDTTRNLLNKTIEEYTDYANICTNLIDEQLREGDNIYEFLDKLDNLIFMDNVNLILVDDKCNWYSEVNHNGRINEVDKYTDSTKWQEIYMTQEVFSGKDCIIVRNRLDSPVTVKTETGKATIEYCAVICYMEDIETSLKVAFPYECNKFILNTKGIMIYKNLQLGSLLDGTNLFTKYERTDFEYGEDGEELVDKVKHGQTSVAEFKISGKEYFVCSTRLKYCNWYMSYVIDADELSSGSYIKTVILFILGMTLMFLFALVVMLRTQMRAKITHQEVEHEKRENEILAQVAKQKSDFLSNMSHDIRTPINGIMGMTALALKEDNSEKTTGYLKKIDNVSHHLLALVNDVLDMSSIENGKLVLGKKPADMSKLMDDCITMLQGQAEENGLEMVTEFDELEHPLVNADELKIRQIVLNILSNAIKYTPRGGHVITRLSEDRCEDGIAVFRIEVEDNGIGMSKDFLEHIWESFSQEEGGSRTTFKGTGLGMSITKSFVELMDGTIEVESEDGKGSKFTVHLPLEVLKANEETIDIDEGGENLKGIRILLVEDNDLNLEIAEELLADEGAEISVARNGREAVDAFAGSNEGYFGVILMDMMMPEMNGVDATKAIRAMYRPDAATVPIIAMTANAYEDDIKATREAGMNAHLTKPLNVGLLIRTIRRLCSR